MDWKFDWNLNTLIALVSAVISFVALYRSSRVSRQMYDLQKMRTDIEHGDREVRLEAERVFAEAKVMWSSFAREAPTKFTRSYFYARFPDKRMPESQEDEIANVLEAGIYVQCDKGLGAARPDVNAVLCRMPGVVVSQNVGRGYLIVLKSNPTTYQLEI